ncbi:hypothetical protein [Aliivibrio fischeri]|uniref:hypothetical protein n=1 Tax=Aliivibrio fischeri TaxID=668 RepID=UPI0007C437DB|nr:hypothetical protein [Aliivibrio fischeri]
MKKINKEWKEAIFTNLLVSSVVLALVRAVLETDSYFGHSDSHLLINALIYVAIFCGLMKSIKAITKPMTEEEKECHKESMSRWEVKNIVVDDVLRFLVAVTIFCGAMYALLAITGMVATYFDFWGIRDYYTLYVLMYVVYTFVSCKLAVTFFRFR